MKDEQNDLMRSARMAGIWYLALAVTGVLGFMIFHPQIYISGDPEKTLTNIMEQESTARIRLLLELAIVASQALAALWFYKLFRNINDWGAWAVGVWGTVNSTAIMISAMSMGSALQVAGSTTLAYDDKVVLIELLSQFISNAWGVGNLFFGLWLIPMGYIVVKSKRMPIWLGRVLIIGGVGYILSGFILYTGFKHPLLDTLVIPATVGEFWMIAYLLIFGIRADMDPKVTVQKEGD